jgi:type IV pilus assembly protein PilE
MKRQKNTQADGFTLIELMIVVAVVAILAVVALPNYYEYVRRGDRADAKSQMLQMQNWMQQQYTLNNAYQTDLTKAPASLKQSPASGTKKYDISLTTDPATTATTYTLQAVPVSTDGNCGTLSITHSGLRAKTGSKDVAYCWNK